MVTEIPKHVRDANGLVNYFESIGIGKVECAHIVPKLANLNELIELRTKILLQIERRYAKLLGNPCNSPGYNPQELKACFRAETQEARDLELEYLCSWAKYSGKNKKERVLRWLVKTNELRVLFWRLDKMIYEERYEIIYNRRHSNSNVGFVTFQSASSAQAAAQLCIYSKPTQMHIKLASEPRDIYWPNITRPLAKRATLSAIVTVIIVFMLLFWLVPVTILSSLVSPEFINGFYPGFVEFVKKNSVLETFLRYTIPSFILYGFNNLAPYLLEWLNDISGIQTKSRRQMQTLTQYYVFLLVTVLLIFTISTTIFSKILEWVENPAKIPKSLADTLPKAGPFFMSYIILMGIGYAPLKLLRLGDIIYTLVQRLFSTSPRDFAQTYGPSYTCWYLMYPHRMIIFAIAITYSSISPLVSPITVLYFLIDYIVSKYLILYVYSPPFETAALHIQKIMKHLVSGMLIYILLMLGIYALRNRIILFLLQIPLVVINVYLTTNTSAVFYNEGAFIPIEMLVGSLSKSAEGSARNILSPVNPKLSDEHKGNKQSFEEIKRMFAKGDANGVYPTGFTDPTRSNLQREQTKTYGSNLKNYTIKSSTTGKHVYDKGVLPTTSLLAGRPSVLYNQIERSLCNSRNYIDTDISTTNDTLLTHRNLHNKPAQDSSTKNNERDIDNTETFSTPNLLTSPKNNDIINDIEFLHQIPTGKDSFSPTINPENDTHSAFCTISSTKKKSRSEHSLSTLEDQKDDVSIISMDRYETSRHLSPDSITNDLDYSHKSSLNTVSVFFKKIIRTLEKFATDYIVLNPYPVPQILSTPPGTEPNHIKTEAVYGAEPLLSSGARDSKSGCITELRWSGNTREEAIAKSMYSDYSQPGMRTCFGILDSDTLTYVYPQLVGTLPQLWLPGKVDSD